MSSSSSTALPIGRTVSDDARARLFIFAYVFAGAFILALGVSWENLADPFVRHDDYPTVFGEAEEYYWKTLSEGRWLNYWYISLPFTLPTQVSFVLYLLAWSVFAAAFATYTIGPRVKVFPGARPLMAALIVLCPQAFDIAQWFNTVMPGIWVMAVYAAIALFVPFRIAVALLFVFVPLSFSAYNTYPFYLLALLLCRVDRDRSFADLVRVVAVFVLAFALAMLVTNALNWYFHGVFGIEEADWRAPNHVEELADLSQNLMKVVRFWQDVMLIYGMGNHLVGYLILVIPLLLALIVLRHDRMLALYAITPVFLGMGLLTYYTLTTGIFVPVRATVFFWLVSCFLLVFGASLLAQTWPRQVILVGMILTLVVFFSREFMVRFGYLQMWQATTKEMATNIPVESERLVIYGPLATLTGAREAAIQSFDGLRFRLRYLTGVPGITCRQDDVDCSGETPPFDPRPRFDSLLFETVGTVTYIRLPELDIPP